MSRPSQEEKKNCSRAMREKKQGEIRVDVTQLSFDFVKKQNILWR